MKRSEGAKKLGPLRNTAYCLHTTSCLVIDSELVVCCYPHSTTWGQARASNWFMCLINRLLVKNLQWKCFVNLLNLTTELWTLSWIWMSIWRYRFIYVVDRITIIYLRAFILSSLLTTCYSSAIYPTCQNCRYEIQEQKQAGRSCNHDMSYIGCDIPYVLID